MLNVNYGSEIDLNCTGDAFPSVTANWSTPLSNGFEISGSPLKIPSFKWMNQGDYICILDNGVKPAAIRKITLFAADKSPNLLKPNWTEVHLFEGDDIIMDCICERCEYPANLWWFYENNSNPLNAINITANLTRYQQLKRIEIRNVSVNDGGLYKCQMECSHQNCMDEFSIKVIVRKPQTIANMPQTQQFYQCKADTNIVDSIKFTHLDGTIVSNTYDCRSVVDDKSANFSIILLGKRLWFESNFIRHKMFLVILETNSTNRLHEFMSPCTLDELQPPELTHILNNEAPPLHSIHSVRFPMNDVFECLLLDNAHSTKLNKNHVFVIFGMVNFIRFIFSNCEISAKLT